MVARKKESGLEEKILESAFEMTKDESFEGFTTAGIANAAEVSEGTLYNYFDNKKSLIIAVFGFAFKRYYSQLNKHISQYNTLAEKLDGLFEYHLNFFGKTSMIFRLLFVPADKGIGPQAIFAKMFPGYRDFISRMLEEHKEEINSDVNIHYIPLFIIGSIQILIFQSIALGGKLNIEEAIEELRKLISDYLIKQKR